MIIIRLPPPHQPHATPSANAVYLIHSFVYKKLVLYIIIVISSLGILVCRFDDGSFHELSSSLLASSTSIDYLVDFQLWISAMLTQLVRFTLPMGEFFTPVLKYLVFAISRIESDSLEKVKFYKQTTAFVKNITERGDLYDHIIITGHSLGGGLAMISGAQTRTPSVAISGPNALISQLVFNVTEESLANYTFNVVPDRDPVPRFDDVSTNFQRIRCTASVNSIAGCHDRYQSLCELIFTCGSNGRPIPCLCTRKFTYAEPTIIDPNGELFDTECPLEE